ncbi:MAG: hypothetical protein AAGA81_20410 [Acidobacteriota bacterium]
MASRVLTTVPGKAILVGEHAAVYGAPALVAGVGLRLAAKLSATSSAGVDLDLPDLGHREQSPFDDLQREADAAREQWQSWQRGEGALPEVSPQSRPGRVVRLALAESLRAVRDRGADVPSGLRLEVRSELPLGAGLGSSAAVAVAVAAAVARLSGTLDNALIETVAGEVEKRQHGSPSGVDVAAVLRGGVLRVARGPEGLQFETLSAAASGRLDELSLLHSGSPGQSTGEVVSAVRSLRESSPAVVEGACAEIEGAETDLRTALEAGAALAPAIRRAHRALVSLGVVPEAVQRPIRWIEEAGGAAKISGAGALEGSGAGLVLAVLPEGTAAVPSPWRRFEAPLGAPGLQTSEG